MEPYFGASTRVADCNRWDRDPMWLQTLWKKQKKNFGLTGTMRKNCIHKVPILQKYDLEKKDVPRGVLNIVLLIKIISKDGRISNQTKLALMFMAIGNNYETVTIYDR